MATSKLLSGCSNGRTFFHVSLVVALCAAGCGRIGFDLNPAPEVGVGGSGPGDSGATGADASMEAGTRGPEGDAGPQADAGPVADGGPEGDAGPQADAATTPDGGGADGGGADGGVSGDGSAGCEPLSADDATCDGVDDDCDGLIDEDYVAVDTLCGVGRCATGGLTACIDGGVVDSCTPGTPAVDDATCDGLDDDCDGEVDEDYVSLATSCGVGACGAVGSTSCVGGSVADDCSPGTPAVDDATCDGLDDDCDGEVDEDYVQTITACGVGACGGSGVLRCVDGGEVDSCSSGEPGTGDATCDGVDDDCDGPVDEDYSESPTSCGVGACASTGALVCSGGGEVDTCTPGAPIGLDDNSGVLGVDDDCDGVVDEDVVCNDPDMLLEAGAHTGLAISPECTHVSVQLWGAGGAAGGASLRSGGRGGGGGYAEVDFTISPSSTVDVLVGAGGVCRSGGSGHGVAAYRGGSGADGSVLLGAGGNGAAGGDGAVSGGGSGADPDSGGRGGQGHYGGGGGGTAGTLVGSAGDGGGGGAASVVRVDSTVVAVAGGGGGGGGAASYLLLIQLAGGPAGGGCSGGGGVGSEGGGGGGGGGLCSGDVVQAASGRDPYDPGNLPSGAAQGGASSCGDGGDGYAVVSFSR